MSVPEILYQFTPNAQQLRKEDLLIKIVKGYEWLVSRWFVYYAEVLPEAKFLRDFDIGQCVNQIEKTIECQRIYSILQFVILDSLQIPEELTSEKQQEIIKEYINELRSFIDVKENDYVQH